MGCPLKVAVFVDLAVVIPPSGPDNVGEIDVLAIGTRDVVPLNVRAIQFRIPP